MRVKRITADPTIGATDLYTSISYVVEAKDLAGFGYTSTPGSGLMPATTISFWFRSNSASHTVLLKYYNGSSTNALFVNFVTASVDIWELVTLNIPAPSTAMASTGLEIFIDPFGGSDYNVNGTAGTWITVVNSATTFILNNRANPFSAGLGSYIDVTGFRWQLTKDAFQVENFDAELLRCMRYYEKSFLYGTKPANGPSTGVYTEVGTAILLPVLLNQTVAGVFGHRHPFAVEKRAIPTVTLYSDSASSFLYLAASSSAPSLPAALTTANISVTQNETRLLFTQTENVLPLWSVLVHFSASAEFT
jgi:hypothetical protein